jgi:hydrogenase maturation protein HypF
VSAIREARRLEVHGVVQGVGFRPFVWRLAAAHRVTGWVRNDGGRVTIHAEGAPVDLDAFARAIAQEAPALARVEDVRAADVELEGHAGFAVDVSVETSGALADAGERLVPPDVATCDACLAEVLDPTDRRFRYPFTNCTDCGPRFTIIEALPYDRDRTSMRAFPMCADCRREYDDPSDRRFHAEPVACPACGPHARLVARDGAVVREPTPADPAAAIVEAADLLRGGAIAAIKGLGGFHLACDATDDAAVARLRDRKRRPAKPFAVMVADADAARTWFAASDAELVALASRQAPIVLVADRGRLAPAIAPGHRRQGAMLPSTPLHHLLLREARCPLVMTSGNATDEPIRIDDSDALERLAGIADAFLLHDRAIVTRYDDSVVRVRTGAVAPSVFRRARSFAPSATSLAISAPPVLGVGAELHGAFCLATGRRAFLSQHLGDLDSEEAMTAYREALDRALALTGIRPELVAHDLHPDLLTTRVAEELELPHIAVQHHHAHVAATMAEHGLQGEVLGLAFDGLGLGEDGTIWGGEFLACSPAAARRVGRLRPVRQPGGDAATRHPWRMALSHAADADVLATARRMLGAPGRDTDVALGQLASGLASPWTSSMGRLFDAVAALTGVGPERATYEGEPAMLLEQAATSPLPLAPFDVADDPGAGLFELDPRPTVADLVTRLAAGAEPAQIAAGFHTALADAAARTCLRIRERTGLDRVVLGGGVFANDRLTTDLSARLAARGFRVFLPREVPVGDGGIALGQVYVAAARAVADARVEEGA